MSGAVYAITERQHTNNSSILNRPLSLEHFLAIRNAALPWLRTAMDLALQTTHARPEVSRIRYSIREPKNGICGCVWLKQPVNGIYGTLYIHRQKVKKKEASHVAIPIGEGLKKIIEESRGNIAITYVVHRIPDRNVKRSKEVAHPTQVAPDYLSRSFSKLRDQLGLSDHLEMEKRPTSMRYMLWRLTFLTVKE